MVRSADLLKVYVVEDSPIILRLLLSGIESGGAELVGSAANAAQAIREIQSLKPHLVTVDLVLASGSGFEVLAALQAGVRNTVAVDISNGDSVRPQISSSHVESASSAVSTQVLVCGCP